MSSFAYADQGGIFAKTHPLHEIAHPTSLTSFKLDKDILGCSHFPHAASYVPGQLSSCCTKHAAGCKASTQDRL